MRVCGLKFEVPLRSLPISLSSAHVALQLCRMDLRSDYFLLVASLHTVGALVDLIFDRYLYPYELGPGRATNGYHYRFLRC